MVTISSSETFAKRRAIFLSVRKNIQRKYPRIFQVTGANQNARKLLSTDLVNTKLFYMVRVVCHFRTRDATVGNSLIQVQMYA